MLCLLNMGWRLYLYSLALFYWQGPGDNKAKTKRNTIMTAAVTKYDPIFNQEKLVIKNYI